MSKSSKPDKGTCLTMGVFDGVHLGHKRLLNQTVTIAKKLNLESLAITFDPSPKEFFSKKVILNLCSLDTRVEKIKNAGINRVEVLKFNQKIADLTAAEFIKKFLINKFKMQVMVVGQDFAMGKDRSGDCRHLKELSLELNFKLVVISKLKKFGEEVSSNRIRDLILNNQKNLASKLL